MVPFSGAEDVSWRVLDLMGRFTTLMIEVKDRELSLEHFITARELDDEFRRIVEVIPLAWGYRIEKSGDEGGWDGRYHLYYDPWTIRFWNYIRFCRIKLLLLLRPQTFIATITELSADICATVPQHTSALSKSFPAYTAGIYTLLYPLFALCSLETTPKKMREWLIGRLEYLGRTSGIQQAVSAAQVVREREEVISN